MKFNTYRLTEDLDLVISSETLNNEITSKLEKVENAIISEYLKKQKGRLGIKTLGNEIRQNDELKKIFNFVKNQKVIIKMTENKRSFMKVFLDNWETNNKYEIYFIILESSFGIDSKLVDKSFVTIDGIKEELFRFNKYFKSRNAIPTIYFIEITQFSSYNIVQKEGYSSIVKK